MSDLPPKIKASDLQKQETVITHTLGKVVKPGCYTVKLAAPITLRDRPVIVVCTTDAPKGRYLLQNINDIVTQRLIQVTVTVIEHKESTVECLLNNCLPVQPLPLEADTVIGKLVAI